MAELTYQGGPGDFTYKTRGSIIETGPGQYGIPNDPSQIKVLKSFGQKLREPKKPMNPGPGSYDVQSTIGKGPRFSIQGRLDNGNKKSKTSYNANAYEKNAYQKQLNPQTDEFSTPGPGDQKIKYDYSNTSSPRPCFGTDSRWKIQTNNNKSLSPGPNAQNVTSNIMRRNNSGIFSKEKRWISKTYTSLTPGPGRQEYDPDILDEHSKVPSIIFGKAKRDIGKNIAKSLSPGPCEYNIRLPKLKSGSVVIGKKSRTSIIKFCTPGPGNYSTLKLPRGIGVRFRTSIKQEKATNLPGPTDQDYADLNKPKVHGAINLTSSRAIGFLKKSIKQSTLENLKSNTTQYNISCPEININN